MISILKNIGLPDSATRNQTGSVGETSIASSHSRILISGNWYACESADDGLTWTHLNPGQHLPPPPSGGFCCDQTLIYVAGQNLFIWLLQYMSNDSENVLRIAVKGGDSDNNDWHWWDVTPTQVNGNWSREWFDYNHTALSDNYLYIGTNMYNMADDWTRSVILRIPLGDLGGGDKLSFDYFETVDNYSLRCVQGASTTMYFASHKSNRQIRVFAWPEDSTDVSIHDVKITRWATTDRATGGYASICPDGANWLSRCDTRITGGWVNDRAVGFMWTANGKGNRKHPHVRVARIDPATMRCIDEPDIWNEKFAYAYPNAYPNMDGTVAITLFLGGGNRSPSMVVGMLDRDQSRWRLSMVQQGTHGPADNKWGDYVTCRLHPDGQSWVAAGFTLQGGGSRTNIEPRLVHFEKRLAAVV